MRIIDADKISFRCAYNGDCMADEDKCKKCADYVCDFEEIQNQSTIDDKTEYIKATEIDDIVIHKSHCDWIVKQATELKALFSYNSERMVELNKSRALADIETIKNSLSELKLYVESL